MNLIDITPNMTSASMAPYKVTSSGNYSVNFVEYHAFNNTIAKEWASVALPAWITMDFGSNTNTDAISIQSRADTKVTDRDASTSCPKSFVIEGSYNGVAFTTISSYTNEVLWISHETRTYIFNKTQNYRYYRVRTLTNNSPTTVYVCIANIRFLKYDQTKPVESSFPYLLPSNSKYNLENINCIGKEGMVSFVNDNNDNYGLLKIVKDGKVKTVALSSLNTDVLFYGNINVVGTSYTLTKDIKDYNYIIVLSASGLATPSSIDANIIYTDSIIFNSELEAYCNNSVQVATSNYYYLSYIFTGINTIKFTNHQYLYWNYSYIYGIIGVK